MPRVVGTDPGTSSLDLMLLDEGEVADQARLSPESLRADPGLLAATLRRWGPLDLVAAPSGYGLPLVRSEAVGEREIDLMCLVRPDHRGRDAGVIGFRSWVRATLESGVPAVFLPGGVHLPTIPRHRKANAIDLGTADKVAVAALALLADSRRTGRPLDEATFAVVEVGSAFTAVLVVERGRLVDASAGTRGPIGVRSGGAWDGEVAYALSPLVKDDLFRGGLEDLGPDGPAAFGESLVKHVAGLKAVTPFETIYLSGARADLVGARLDGLGVVRPLPSLPGAWVKHAAQGAALLADGLAGGAHGDLVGSLELRGASGTIWDGIAHRRTEGVPYKLGGDESCGEL
jgi:predicted butyrate kinase (DUF1464 family)